MPRQRQQTRAASELRHEQGVEMEKTLVSRRPAETGAVASAMALLIVRVLGVDDVDVVTSLAIVIGAVPAAVTWVVERRFREQGTT